MKKYFIFVVLAYFQSVIGQSNIKLNEVAPEISITDWVLNVPKDKNLTNKYIVLEFWATWCGPCIKAVPHLNEIQEKTKRKDLYFISITDESVEKIQRISKRIKFNSIVVSDQSKKTQENFGDGVSGLEAYPFTVLIDNKGIIKWIGMPESLTVDIVSAFLSNKLKPSNSFLKNEGRVEETIPVTENAPDPLDEFLDIATNKNIIYKFDISKTDNEDESSSKFNENIFMYNSISIKGIFSEILGHNPILVEVDEKLNNQKYKITYKNKGKFDKGVLENEFLNFLKVKKSTVIKNLNSNTVTIKNASLLEETLDEGMSSISDAGSKKLITGLSLKSLMIELNKFSKDIYEFDTKDNGKFYDFVVDFSSKQSIINSLNSYGLEFKTVNENKEVIILEALE